MAGGNPELLCAVGVAVGVAIGVAVGVWIGLVDFETGLVSLQSKIPSLFPFLSQAIYFSFLPSTSAYKYCSFDVLSSPNIADFFNSSSSFISK